MSTANPINEQPTGAPPPGAHPPQPTGAPPPGAHPPPGPPPNKQQFHMMTREQIEQKQKQKADGASRYQGKPPPGEWRDSEFECVAPEDCVNTCMVCMMGWPFAICFLYGQLFQRVLTTQKGCGACVPVTLFFYVVYALYYFVSQAASRAKAEGELYYYLLLGVLGLIAVLPTAVVYKVRQAIRKRDGLAGQYCNCQPCCDGADCEDMLCAWLCNPCATCHLARHEGFANGEYGICRPRGIPDEEEGLPA